MAWHACAFEPTRQVLLSVVLLLTSSVLEVVDCLRAMLAAGVVCGLAARTLDLCLGTGLVLESIMSSSPGRFAAVYGR